MPKQKLFSLFQKVSIPRKRILLGGAGLICLVLLTSWMAWPRTIAFSYAGQSCVFDPQVLPSTVRQVDHSQVKLSKHSDIRLGSIQLASFRTCVEPTAAPIAGESRITTQLFGIPFIAASYTVKIPDAPAVKPPTQSKLAVTKSLTTALDSEDQTFTYELSVADRTTKCEVQNSQISCSLKPLRLDQGTSYDYKIVRTFADKPIETVATKTFETLPAVTITDSSPQPGQVMYAKSKTLSVTASKPLSSAKATLKRSGDAPAAIPVSTIVNNSTIEVTVAEDLPREMSYELDITSAIATDGSDLIEPYRLGFQTSGGPQVASVSIGTSNVPVAQTVTVTFDQPLKPDQDIGKFIAVSGVPATINYDKATATIRLGSAGRCTPFTITVKKGLVGAENDLASTKEWSHASHITCSEARVIGSSREGRPITAYYYGNGDSTILFTGGIHGEERSGSATMNSWTSYLEANAHKLPAGRQVVVVPSINPDGLARGTRLNAAGVNLDRNYPSRDWAKSIQTSGGHLPAGGGASAGSEPETKAVIGLVNSLSIRLAVSHHAQGSLVGSNSVGDADSLARTYGSAVGYGSMIGSAEDTMGYAITGEFETWLGERRIPAILIELPNRSGNFFGRHQSILWQMATI